jgi:hypothetical protein
MSKKKVGMLFLALLLPLVFLACSSGGGGGGGSSDPGNTGNASALVVADKVSVVDAKLSGSVAAVKPILRAVSVPSGSDYNTDQTNVYVQERSVEMFGTINEILCMIGQTKYEEMLNKGPYTAQIDENQCSSNKGDASQAGQESANQSSGATAPKYELWTVESKRVDDNSPQILTAWIHQEASEHEPAQIISAKVVITEGKSAANPYGIFTINFRANLVSDPSVLSFKGILKSERDPADPNRILLKFVDGTPAGAPEPREEAVTLNKNADGASGSGTGYRKETWMENGTPVTRQFNFDIAYDNDYFLRKDVVNAVPDVCLDRNSFDMSAWRYGLYDAATGARVSRNSGFPIKFGNYYGNVGYWGLWLPNNVTLNNGDTVYKHNYQTNTDTPYTVFIAKGKLKKHTKKNFTLDDIKNIPLDYREQIPGSMSEGTNFRVVWDGLNFVKKASMPSNCSGNCTWADIATLPTPTVNFSQVQWSELNFWSQALGGQVRVPLGTVSTPCTYVTSTTGPGYTSCPAPTGATNVVFFQEDIIYPNDTTVPASFACYDNCPKAGSTGINPMDSNYPTWDQNTGQSMSHTYIFNTSSMLMMDGANPVIASTTSTMNQWGYMSGALVDPNTANLATLLDCNWDGDNNPTTQPQTCGWKAQSAFDVFYTWETGPNNWNQFTAVKDSAGAFVTFEPPLQVEYVHVQSDVNARDYKYNGAKFSLEYSGFGELHGIPATCVNMDTGAIISCDQGGQGIPVRWVPEFFIPAGSSLQSGAYIAKPLEMEQRMRQSDGCAGAGLVPQSYTLPLIAEWQDPDIGAEPSVTVAPAVVGGVLQ